MAIKEKAFDFFGQNPQWKNDRVLEAGLHLIVQCLLSDKRHPDEVLGIAVDALRDSSKNDDTMRLCLVERLQGIADPVIDDRIVVRFGAASDQIPDQVYSKDQFIEGTVPNQWDRITAFAIGFVEPPMRQSISDLLTTEELEHVEKASQSYTEGPIRI